MTTPPPSKPYCFPVCLSCREAPCPKALPPPGTPPARAPYWPDSLAGQRLACGCRAPIIPTVLGRLDPRYVMCDTHGWQPIPKKEGKNARKSKTRGTASAQEGPSLWDQLDEEIPFL